MAKNQGGFADIFPPVIFREAFFSNDLPQKYVVKVQVNDKRYIIISNYNGTELEFVGLEKLDNK